MTHKQIAEIIRRGQEDELNSLANELDPPKPETGTVVWWKRHDYTKWNLGYVADRQYGVVPLNDEIGFDDYYLPWADVEWKPARILDDDEVAIPVEELIGVRKDISNGRYRDVSDWAKYYIDREEALRMERER